MDRGGWLGWLVPSDSLGARWWWLFASGRSKFRTQHELYTYGAMEVLGCNEAAVYGGCGTGFVFRSSLWHKTLYASQGFGNWPCFMVSMFEPTVSYFIYSLIRYTI